MPKMGVLWLLLLPAVVTAPRSSFADPLTPGQQLQVAFDFGSSAPFPASLGSPDLLQFSINGSRIDPFGSFTASLYDGAALLGTYTTSVNGDTGPGGLTFNAFFRDPSSFTPDIGPFNPMGTADFGAISDGSIRGLIVFSITNGLIDLDLASTAITIARIQPHVGGFEWTGFTAANPVVRSADIVAQTPEPATWLLSMTGIAIAARRRRGEKRD